jgi:hypothetical protein
MPHRRLGWAGLGLGVTHVEIVVNAHDMKIAQEHVLARDVVSDDRPEGARVNKASDRSAWPDADPAFERSVGARIDFRHQLGYGLAGSELVEFELALNHVRRVAINLAGNPIFAGDWFLLFHQHTDGDDVRGLPAHLFVADVDAGNARPLQQVRFGFFFGCDDFFADLCHNLCSSSAPRQRSGG